MTRTIYPMAVADVSAFAKSLREQMGRLDHAPTHVEMLNLLSRAAGFRNYQHFRSSADAAEISVTRREVKLEQQADAARVSKTLRVFDTDGQIIRWPGKRSQQELCLWFLWTKIPPRLRFTEREISERLNALHLFGDAALLRRDLVDVGLMRRNRDGSDYQRVEKAPPPELKLLTEALTSPKQKAA
ncbi:hypothetical protein ABID21_003946 [Pseudorhizobium tarimense]|uniref:DUF2087 domain-containing protein n=1 Tax=Pseudorhizobium tarimense TaxID=1079109 RepID=A0ABV2HB93_9HYPH|nr:DUF2087 domain-containing protein [Pseudorhizobium tarimense]MCJ8520726.1 DUF2087 domain-containing protein [Pseudorhizobium tarimense]